MNQFLSNKLMPYTVKAVYDYCVTNDLRPYISFDADLVRVYGGTIPDMLTGIQNLSIDPKACLNLSIGDIVSFDVTIDKSLYHIALPITHLRTIYALENGQGIDFREKQDKKTSAAPILTLVPKK